MKLFDPLPLCSDEQLLARFRAGQTDAFGVLVRRYERELYGYLRRYLADGSLAEDVFQNTFLQVYQKLEQYQPDKPVRPWLYAIATNQAIDALRRVGRRQTVSLDQDREEGFNGAARSLVELMEARGPGPLEHLQEAERRALVRAGVDCLPDHLRSAVILAYYQGLKYREIAEALDIPVGTVKSRLHAALGRLQELWAQTEALRK